MLEIIAGVVFPVASLISIAFLVRAQRQRVEALENYHHARRLLLKRHVELAVACADLAWTKDDRVSPYAVISHLEGRCSCYHNVPVEDQPPGLMSWLVDGD